MCPLALQVYPHGSTDALPFATMGSGSLNAMAVFEADYKDGMSKEEAMALVARAIRSGVLNDLGSGSNIDLCVITKDGVEYLRNHEFLQTKTYQRKYPVVYPPGTASECMVPVVGAGADHPRENDVDSLMDAGLLMVCCSPLAALCCTMILQPLSRSVWSPSRTCRLWRARRWT